MRGSAPSSYSRVIFSSSIAAYGEPEGDGVIDEMSPANLASYQPGSMLYSCTKLIGEALCKLYSQKHGIDAVARIDALKPDIVFLDIQMPGLNGMEVARHIPEPCQVVFVTAYADYALAAFDAGALNSSL